MSKTKKIAVLAIIAMVLTLMPTALFAATADSDRLAGADRIGTALEIASAGWSTASAVVLAPADQANLVDSLAAAPLAGQENAPILLTFKGSLDSAVKARIAALGASKVYVIGAISSAVADEVDAISGVTVEKLAGADRWATADAINAKLTSPAGTFVVGYNAIPDALSVASYAAAKDFAIVLANADGTVPASKLVGSATYLVGGTGVVKDYAGATRLGGADRYATNKAVVDGLSFDFNRVYVANGLTMVDALAASSLAGKYSSPILLSNGSSVPAASVVSGKVDKVIALGGTGVVSDAVKNSITVAPITEITSVEAVSGQVFDSTKSGQSLKFTVNGGRTITLDALDDLGYDILFTALEVTDGSGNATDVFAGDDTSVTGSLSKGSLVAVLDGDASAKVKYNVTIEKGGDTFVSETVTFKVVDGGQTAASSITSYKLYLDAKDNGYDSDEDIKLTSNTAVEGEVLFVTDVKATALDGTLNVDVTANISLESSDPFVASVDDNVITAEGVGTTTITINSGSVSKTFSLKVTSTDRKAASVTSTTSSLTVANGGTRPFEVVVKDQYGDPWYTGATIATYGDSFTITDEVLDADDDSIAEVNTAVATSTSGKVTFLLETVAKGTGTFKVKKEGTGTALLSIPVTVKAMETASTYKIEALNSDSTDFTLDINPQAATDDKNKKVEFYVVAYGSSGTYIGPTTAASVSLTNPTKAVADDGALATPANSVYTVTVDENWVNTGKATIVATVGTKTATKSVTVKSTIPSITSVTFNAIDILAGQDYDLSDILDLDDVAINGAAGGGKLMFGQANSTTTYVNAGDIVLFYDVAKAGVYDDTFELGVDVPVAKVAAIKSSAITGAVSLAEADNEVTLDVVSSADGTISLGIYKWGTSTVYKSVTLDVEGV